MSSDPLLKDVIAPPCHTAPTVWKLGVQGSLWTKSCHRLAGQRQLLKTQPDQQSSCLVRGNTSFLLDNPSHDAGREKDRHCLDLNYSSKAIMMVPFKQGFPILSLSKLSLSDSPCLFPSTDPGPCRGVGSCDHELGVNNMIRVGVS